MNDLLGAIKGATGLGGGRGDEGDQQGAPGARASGATLPTHFNAAAEADPEAGAGGRNAFADATPPPRGGARDAEHAGELELPSLQAATGEGATPAAEASMQAFFADVSEVKGLMAEIRVQARALSDAHEASKTVTRSKEMEALRVKMRGEINAVSKNAEAIKRRLAALERGNSEAIESGLVQPGSASERTRSSITAALKRRLRDLMAEFADLRARLNREYREVVERRVYTVTGSRPDEEQIEALIETGEGENVFRTAIQEQGRGAVTDAMAEIRERHNAVVELERSLLELHQIFLDMAVLVEAQGEQLDSIEAQVARSVEYVQAGTTHLVAAKQHQRNTRKWMCCGIIAAVILIILIVLLAVGLTGGFK